MSKIGVEQNDNINNFEIHADHLILAINPEEEFIDKKKQRTCHFVDFAVSVKMKEIENK